MSNSKKEVPNSMKFVFGGLSGWVFVFTLMDSKCQYENYEILLLWLFYENKLMNRIF